MATETTNRLLTRIRNRIPLLSRNGHSAPVDISQSSPIGLAGDNAKPEIDTEYGSYRGYMHGQPVRWLPNDMPVLGSFGHRIVDEMMTDDTFGTCVELKKAAALSTPWSWEAASDDPEHQTHALMLTSTFETLDSGDLDANGVNTGVRNKLRDIASNIQHGFSITNPVFHIIPSGPFAGLIGVADLKTKPPHEITFETDEFLNIAEEGIVQMRSIKLPRDQFLIASYNSQFNNPYGYADSCRAYDRWNAKRFCQRMQDMYTERHAAGTWAAFEDLEKSTQWPDGLKEERAALDSLLGNKQAKSAWRGTTRFDLKVFEPGAAAADYWEKLITRLNMQIARAVFFPDKAGMSAGSDAGGAYALGKVHFDMLLFAIYGVQQDLAVVMKRLGMRIIKANYGPQEKYPNFKFGPMTNEEKVWWIAQIASLVQNGVLTHDASIEKKVRETMQLPEQEEPTETPQQRATDATDPNAEVVEPGDGTDETIAEFAAPDFSTTIRKALQFISENDRVVIAGGPKVGKTTISTIASERYKLTVKHADSLVGKLGWSDLSAEVEKWLDESGRWVVEGVATVRAVRKWLADHPSEKPPFAVLMLTSPLQGRGKAQRAMAGGVTTIWGDVLPELKARKATVLTL